MSGTQALDRSFELLRLVVASDGALTFTELVERTGLARSTTSRMLGALERAQLLERDDAGAWRGGAVFADYAARFDRVSGLVTAAHPFMEAVAEATSETVNLAVVRDDRVRHVAQIDAQFVVGAANWTGVDVPGHCSALGKVMFAFGALHVPRGHLERPTGHSIATRAELAREIETVATRGWAQTRGELEEGLDAIAVPVLGPDNRAVAAIGVSGPTYRLGERHGEVADVLVRESRRLSRVLARRVRG